MVSLMRGGRHSRLATEDPDETGESECSEAEEDDRVAWLELLSSSRKGEEQRLQERSRTRDYCYLHEGARLFHAEKHLKCIQKEMEERASTLRGGHEANMRKLLVEFQDLSEEEKRLRELAKEPTDILETLSPVLGLDQVKAMKAISSPESRYNTWVNELNRMTPLEFVRIITVLTAEAGQENLCRFINSLSLELAWPSVQERLKHLMGLSGRGTPADHSEWKRQMGQDFHVLGHDPACEPPSDIYEHGYQEAFSKKHRQQWDTARRRLTFGSGHESDVCSETLWLMKTHFQNKVFFGDGNAVYSASFCVTPAVQLLRQSDFELTLVLKSLVDMGHFSHSFVTPLGRAVLELACERVAYIRWTHALKDFLYVFVLVFMGHTLRESSMEMGAECPQWALYLFLSLAFLVAFNFVSKVIIETTFFVYSSGGCNHIFAGIFAAVSKHTTTWNVLIVAAELFSIWVSIKFTWSGIKWHNQSIPDSIENSFHFFEENPATMSSLVLIRWTILSTSFLQMEQVGRNMVPVVIAVCQPASMFFLFFLSFMILAAFHAYYVFPIEENVGETAHWLDNYVFNTFLKVFRLTVLGDFDLAELEGLDDKVVAKLTRLNATNSKIIGSVDVDSSDWTDQYHRAVRYQFVIISMVITVVVMNVYIGLLGELYQKAEGRSRQLYNHYRASCAYRHMCERSAFMEIFCCGWRTSSRRSEDQKGLYWFIYNKKQLTDEEGVEKQMQ